MAEYDNYRKRRPEGKKGLYGDIKSDTVSKFLPVYDNLVRALAQSTEDEAYRKGVEMIMNQFNTTLEKLGVSHHRPRPEVRPQPPQRSDACGRRGKGRE